MLPPWAEWLCSISYKLTNVILSYKAIKLKTLGVYLNFLYFFQPVECMYMHSQHLKIFIKNIDLVYKKLFAYPSLIIDFHTNVIIYTGNTAG